MTADAPGDNTSRNCSGLNGASAVSPAARSHQIAIEANVIDLGNPWHHNGAWFRRTSASELISLQQDRRSFDRSTAKYWELGRNRRVWTHCADCHLLHLRPTRTNPFLPQRAPERQSPACRRFRNKCGKRYVRRPNRFPASVPYCPSNFLSQIRHESPGEGLRAIFTVALWRGRDLPDGNHRPAACPSNE